MAFVDEVTIKAHAGKGGDGVVRWLHIKGTEKGGPAGGDGGRGGDVILEGVRDLAALSRYRFEKDFRARNGGAGENDNRHGADGAAVVLPVPIGTLARVTETGKEFDLSREGERVVVFAGGAGGKGNARFKGSMNQNPFQATLGKEGENGSVLLSLKIIADAGLIGLPNAGKSSLLNALTHARSKVGAYPFTTLDPYLGDFYGYILADIPGLISGASAGRGLGSKFLKHVERTKMLVHLVSAEQENLIAAYQAVRAELAAFSADLSSKPEMVVISKIDLIPDTERENLRTSFGEATGKKAVLLSTVDADLLKAFSDRLSKELAAAR